MPSERLKSGTRSEFTPAAVSGVLAPRGYLARVSTTRANARAGLVADVLISLLLLGAGLYTAAAFGLINAALTIALGLVLFSFVEYCVHRWLFHGRASALEAGHRTHHEDPAGYDALPFFAPPLGMLALAALLALILPVSTALLLAGAVAAGYAAYGLGHTAIHSTRFRGPIPMRWAAHHHIHHHHADRNFGVTTPLWDIVLGTRYRHARPGTSGTKAAASHRVPWSSGARRAGLLIVVAVLATLAVPILLGGRDVLLQTLNFSPRSYAALVALIATSWIARAWKFHLLLQRIGVCPGFARTLAMSLAIDFAFISTPAGVGGYAASIYYVRRSGASTSAATTVTAVDQLLDLVFFALILPIAGLSLLWSELPTALATLAFATSASMIAIGVGALLMRHGLVRWLLGENLFVRRWPASRRQQHVLQKFFASLHADVHLLMSSGLRGAIAIGALTALQWVTRYGILWAVLVLLGHRVSFALILLLQSLILHAALWTGVPSGGGSAEVGLSAALAAWVPATSMATALLLWRLVTFDVCLIVGIAAVALLAHRPWNTHGAVPAPLPEGVD